MSLQYSPIPPPDEEPTTKTFVLFAIALVVIGALLIAGAM